MKQSKLFVINIAKLINNHMRIISLRNKFGKLGKKDPKSEHSIECRKLLYRHIKEH